LAVEDLISTNGRAKVDWYPGNLFIVLHLQKLIRLNALSREGEGRRRRGGLFGRWRRPARPHTPGTAANGSAAAPKLTPTSTESSMEPAVEAIPGVNCRTIQRYRGVANMDRDLFMERNSPLTRKG